MTHQDAAGGGLREVRGARRVFASVAGGWLGIAAACLIALPLTGCNAESSGDTAHWTGEVTIDGQSLPADAEGVITFRPTGAGGGKAVSVPIEDGRYDSPKTPRGQVTAYFDIHHPTGRTHYSERVSKEIQETESLVPAEHAQGMKLDVTGDNAEANLDL